jgi:intracellular septation protein A
MTQEAEPIRAPAAERRLEMRDFRFDFGVAQGGLPILVFWIANNMGPTQVAIVLALAVAVVVFVRNRQSGVIRALTVVSFAIVAASGVAGLVLASDKAFAAQNIVSDFAFAAIGLGSLAMRKPIIGVITRELIPGLRRLLPVDDRTFVMLTIGWVVLNLVQAVVRIYLLDVMSANTYIIVSRVFAFPLNVAFIAAVFVLVSRRVREERLPVETLQREELKPDA